MHFHLTKILTLVVVLSTTLKDNSYKNMMFFQEFSIIFANDNKTLNCTVFSRVTSNILHPHLHMPCFSQHSKI